MKSADKFWNKMSHNYDFQVNSKYAQTYDETIKITQKYLKNSDVVLDLGCGTGITTIKLAADVKKIDAIDISENMIDIAKSKANKHGLSNIEFGVLDIYSEKLKKGSYDVIMAFNILYFIKDLNKLLYRVNELLKPDGIFISSTDCLGEKQTLTIMIQSLLSKMGLIPYIKKLKISELKEMITANNFSVVEAQNLYDSPPNYYIAAKRR